MLAGFEAFTLPLILWIAVVIVLAGLSQGALGIGFPTIATPLIALATDIHTAVIVVLLPCLAAVVMTILGGASLRRVLAEFWMMPLYAFVGASIGTRIFVAYPGFPYGLLLAGIIIVYLNLDRITRTDWALVKRRRRPFGVLFGTLAGLSEGTANVAAPPLVVYYLALGLEPMMLVQAMNICFLAGKLTQFFTLATAGGVTAPQWLATFPLAVLGAAAAAYGVRIRNRIEAATYRRWLRGALLAMALILVGQYVYEA